VLLQTRAGYPLQSTLLSTRWLMCTWTPWPFVMVNARRGIPVAHYLVRARPKLDCLPRLGDLLAQDAFLNLRHFGWALTHSVTNARIEEDERAVCEDEDARPAACGRAR
jgi:hypothetical protein